MVMIDQGEIVRAMEYFFLFSPGRWMQTEFNEYFVMAQQGLPTHLNQSYQIICVKFLNRQFLFR